MWMLSFVFLLSQAAWLNAVQAVSQPATQPVVAVAPAAAPSRVEVVVKSEPAATQPAPPQTLYELFARTRLGQLFRGEQRLQLQELEHPAFWFDMAKDLIEAIVTFIPRLVVSFICLAVFWVCYRAIRKLATTTLNQAHVDPSVRDLLLSLIKWSVMGFGLVIACNQIGIPIVAMLTGVSIIGLAVGFAAQETLANFIAGVVIFIDKPFKVGDLIDVEEVFAKVERITFRSTRMLTGDGEVIILPNTAMLSQKLANHTTHPLTRVKVKIGIAYKASIDEARAVLLELTHGDSRILRHSPPAVAVTECAESSVDLELGFWVGDELLARAMRSEYLEKAKKALDQAGIDIPFPHVQMLMEQTPAVGAIVGALGSAQMRLVRDGSAGGD